MALTRIYESHVMTRLAAQFAVLLLLSNLSYAAQWKSVDMNPGKLEAPATRDATSIKPDCDGTPCGYDIHYFSTQSSRPGAKTILYISGGPGQIVDRKQPELDPLKDSFNIVYFDIRGAGLSAPQSAVDNSTDKFLRAKYVIKDIEEIRKKILVDKPWDAIYGHSAGTVFAQLYAEQFGKISRMNDKVRVKTLILSAPISRHIDNEPFRAEMIATNLKNILENNTELECPWKQPARSMIAGVLNRIERAAARLLDFFVFDQLKFLKSTNNFCFLDSTRIDNIRATLEKKLNLIGLTYGSVSFVFENHKDLAKDDSQFRNDFPYPDKFFLALRLLDRLGSPRQKESDLDFEKRSLQVDAALVLGYYLDSPRPQDASSKKCNSKAQFFSSLFPDIADVYCRRFEEAAEMDTAAGKGRSTRAANVLGIHEGIHRWPVRLMGRPPQGCNRGSQFLAFANDPGNDKKTAKELLSRVGFETNKDICAWDAAKHKHSVPSLILKGSMDAATHGCQAEHFFKAGLLNTNKIFVEFPDLGHDWISEIKPERKDDLRTLLEKFVNDPAQFKENGDAKQALTRLGAINRTAASSAASGC